MDKKVYIYDPIYGNMRFSYYAHIIIKNPIFQRLNNLKQLGTCSMVYPSATHTRFEHSLGTYHLIDIFLMYLFSNSTKTEIYKGLVLIHLLDKYKLNDEYDLENIKELIKIAGLCHDIGHGPYSHLFDDHFLKPKLQSDFVHHEFRSTYLVEYIIKNNPELDQRFDSNDISFIQSLINPSKDNNGFIYQIVSNNLNGIDMDKFDYLTRDSFFVGVDLGFNYKELIDKGLIINNNICYPNYSFKHIINIFEARKKLHKDIVNHPSVIYSQIIISNMLEEINKKIKIIENLEDLNFFIKLTDEFITNYVNFHKILLLDNDINSEMFILNDNLINKKYANVLNLIYSTNPLSNIDNVYSDKIIYKSVYGYINDSNKNPLDNVQLFKNYNGENILCQTEYKYDKTHSEYVYIIYDK